MKAKLLTSLLAATATLVSISAPAQAFMFGTKGIQFEQDTTVDFTFEGSEGAYTSILRVFEVMDSGFKDVSGEDGLFRETRASDGSGSYAATCGEGKAVLNCTNSFTFEKNKLYTFVLDTPWARQAPEGYWTNLLLYSTSSLNTETGGSQQAVFGGYGTSEEVAFEGSSYQSGNPFTGAVKFAFDDRGTNAQGVIDWDYNDFRVTAKARAVSQSVPEPSATLAMFAVGMLGLLKLRRRNNAIG